MRRFKLTECTATARFMLVLNWRWIEAIIFLQQIAFSRAQMNPGKCEQNDARRNEFVQLEVMKTINIASITFNILSFLCREFRKWRKNYLCDNSERKLENMARAKLDSRRPFFSLHKVSFSFPFQCELKIFLRSLIKLHFYACDPLLRRLAHSAWRGPFASNAWLAYFSSYDVCSVSTTRFSAAFRSRLYHLREMAREGDRKTWR